MTTHETHLALRVKSLLLVAIATCCVALATLGPATEKASAYWVCGPTAAVWRGGDFRCQHDTRRTFRYIEKTSSPRAYAVYRSTSYGGSSSTGAEYYSPTSDWYLQDFGCVNGYPNAHNWYSSAVYVVNTLAGTVNC